MRLRSGKLRLVKHGSERRLPPSALYSLVRACQPVGFVDSLGDDETLVAALEGGEGLGASFLPPAPPAAAWLF